MPTTKIKYKLSSTVPVAQYGNLIPEIELEGTDINKLHEKAMSHVQSIWDDYGKDDLKKKTEKSADGIKFDEVLSFTGEKILWSDYLHEYRSLDHVKLTSGSAYSAMLEKPFNSELLSEKSANAWNVDRKELAELWKMNGRLSTEYGSAIHTALEMYHRFHKLGLTVQEHKELPFNYCLPKNEHLQSIVLDFVNLFGCEAEVEVFVTDVKNKMAGQIDRLSILDLSKKVCRIGDYKTNFEIKKAKLKTYSHQMSFYAQALENHGWTVEGLDLYHYDGKTWNKYELDRQTIDTSLFQ